MKQSTVTLSTVTVTYNSENEIQDFLDSLLDARKYIDVEVIIVDNGSEDKTMQMCKEHILQPILIENNADLGIAKGNNKGLKQAQGLYVALLNPDIYFTGEILKGVIDYLEQTPHVMAAAPALVYPDGSQQISARNGFQTVINEIFIQTGLWKIAVKLNFRRDFFKGVYYGDKQKPVEAKQIITAFLVFRKEVFEKIGYWDEQFFFCGDDVDFCKRMNDNNMPLHVLPYLKSVHIKGYSLKKDPFTGHLHYTKSELKFLRKHYGRIAPLILFIFYRVWFFVLFCYTIFRRYVFGNRKYEKGMEIYRKLSFMSYRNYLA